MEFQLILVMLLTGLTVSIIAVCIYLITVLKGLTVTLEKANVVLDGLDETVEKTNVILEDVEKVTYSVSNPSVIVSTLLGGFKQALQSRKSNE